MKNTIIYIILSMAMFWNSQASAQGNCFITPIQTSSCCYEFDIEITAGLAGLITDIYVDANANPPLIADIASATGNAASGFTGNTTGTQTAVFSNGTPIPVNTPVRVGEICYSNVNSIGVVTPLMTIGDANGTTYCTENVEMFMNCIEAATYKKVYGTVDDESVNVTKAFGDGQYLAGWKNVNAERRPTLIKVDITTGNVLWERYINEEGEFRDLAYDAANDQLIVVGTTQGQLQPSGLYDNRSVITRWSTGGNLIASKMYDQNGREGFERVLVHENPLDPNFPIYVLGSKNEDGTPISSTDVSTLFNFDGGLNLNWKFDYLEVNGIELEAVRGLEDLSDGHLAIVGNGSIANEGVVIKVNGGTGQHINAYYHPGVIDWYDAMELSNGNIVLAGIHFSSKQSLMIVVDQNFVQQGSGIEFFSTRTFKEVWQDTNGFIYAIADEKNGLKHNVVYKLELIGNNFNPIWAKYLEQGETAYRDPQIYVDKDFDRIFYADARENHPAGFGQYDILYGSFDLDMTCDCDVPFNTSSAPFNVGTTSITLNAQPKMEPAQITVPQVAYMGTCTDFCAPINPPGTCDFTWTANCFDVNFTATSTGLVPPLTYDWDWTCDNTIDFSTNSNTASHTYTPPLPSTQTHNVCLTITDAAGDTCMVQKTITVQDITPPTINCPSNITVTIPGCQGGTNVNFPNPTVSDNCSMASFVCDAQSGDYFECGLNTVTCTATDASGNMSTCTFTINVICECGELAGSGMVCNSDDENKQDFFIQLNSLSGHPNPSSICTAGVSTSQAGVTLSNISTSWVGNQVTISGTAEILGCPFPNSLSLLANLNCTCPNGDIFNCDFPVSIGTLCCKTVSIDDDLVCKNTNQVTMPLVGCQDLCDVIQVKWYVADTPCPTSVNDPAWLQIQVSNSCQDLLLDPRYHNGDVCIRAEAVVGPGDGPCSQSVLFSNIATLTLCEPITCSIPSQTYCYAGTPILPTLLTATLNPSAPNCSYTAQWYDPQNQLIPGATGLTYQPTTPLSIPIGSTDCSVTYTYRCELTSECGVESCTASIKLDNDDAPLGNLYLDPNEPLPFCPGEDATLRYDPACAGEPEMWDWYGSTDGVSYTQITVAGTQNPLWNTNRLYQDTWYRVEKTNGTCPADEIDFYIPVLDPLMVTSFDADAKPFCAPTDVDLTVDFKPNLPASSPCMYTVDFYKDGNLIHSISPLVQAGPVSWTYSPTNPEDIPGNYYAIVSNTCCPGQAVKSPVEVVDEPCELVVLGPCFRCNIESVTLTGVVINPHPTATCTYQWYDNGTLIAGATGLSLVADNTMVGPFELRMTCVLNGNTCIKSAFFDLKQCGHNPFVSTIEIELLDAKIYPNPTQGDLTIEFESRTSSDMELNVFDINGRLISSQKLDIGIDQQTLQLTNNPSGVYFVQVIQDKNIVWMEKVLKL